MIDLQKKLLEFFGKPADPSRAFSEPNGHRLYRNWMLVVSARDMDNFISELSKLHTVADIICSPVHDADIVDGKRKFPHYHVILSFFHPVSVDYVFDIMNDAGLPTIFERIYDLHAAVRYLVHLDSYYLAPYLVDDVFYFDQINCIWRLLR